jgi:mannitol-specific phosphotransferase system IIBC component
VSISTFVICVRRTIKRRKEKRREEKREEKRREEKRKEKRREEKRREEKRREKRKSRLHDTVKIVASVCCSTLGSSSSGFLTYG